MIGTQVDMSKCREILRDEILQGILYEKVRSAMQNKHLALSLMFLLLFPGLFPSLTLQSQSAKSGTVM